MNNSAGILRVETHFSKNNVPPVGVAQGKKISFADEHGDQLAHIAAVVKQQTGLHSPVFRTVRAPERGMDTPEVAKHHHTQQQHNQEAARGCDPTVLNYTTDLEEKIPLVYAKSCEIFCIAPCSNVMSKAVKKAVIPPIKPPTSLSVDTDVEIMADDIEFTDADSAMTALTGATSEEAPTKFAKNLNLKNLSLGNVQSCAILKSVQLVEHLQEVDLTGNRLDESGAAAIIKSLRGTGVRSVVLDANKIGKKGVNAIIAFLENRPIDKHDEASIKRQGLSTGNNTVTTNSVGTGVGSRTYGKGNVPLHAPPPGAKGTFKNLLAKSSANYNRSVTEDVDDDTSVVTFESMPNSIGRSMYAAIQPTFPMAAEMGHRADHSAPGSHSQSQILPKGSLSMSILSPLKHNAVSSSIASKNSKSAARSQSMNDVAQIHIPLLSSFASSNMLTPLPHDGSHFIDDEESMGGREGDGSVDGSAFYTISGGGSRTESSVGNYNYRILGAGPPPKLMKLCLNENKLGDYLIAKLIKCLNATCIYTLEELGLRNNMCGMQTAKALNNYLSTVTTNSSGTGTGRVKLKILDVGWNSLGDMGVWTIFNSLLVSAGLGNTALIKNFKKMDIPLPSIVNFDQVSICSLSLDWNGLNGSCAAVLEKLVALVGVQDDGSNGGVLKSLCIENNPIPAPVMLTLVQRIQNIRRPDICKVSYSSFHFEFDALQSPVK